MKKPHKHTVMSNQKCDIDGCKHFIKQNVLDRKENKAGLICYHDYDRLVLQPRRDNSAR